MTHLEQAIRDAVEKGGYAPRFTVDILWFVKDNQEGQALVLLDPAFWQALGKARGWSEVAISGYFVSGEVQGKPMQIKLSTSGEWQANWHRSIDHLASGKDVESFFADL